MNVGSPEELIDGDPGLSHPFADPNDSLALFVVDFSVDDVFPSRGHHVSLQLQQPLLNLTARLHRVYHLNARMNSVDCPI